MRSLALTLLLLLPCMAHAQGRMLFNDNSTRKTASSTATLNREGDITNARDVALRRIIRIKDIFAGIEEAALQYEHGGFAPSSNALVDPDPIPVGAGFAEGYGSFQLGTFTKPLGGFYGFNLGGTNVAVGDLLTADVGFLGFDTTDQAFTVDHDLQPAQAAGGPFRLGHPSNTGEQWARVHSLGYSSGTLLDLEIRPGNGSSNNGELLRILSADGALKQLVSNDHTTFYGGMLGSETEASSFGSRWGQLLIIPGDGSDEQEWSYSVPGGAQGEFRFRNTGRHRFLYNGVANIPPFSDLTLFEVFDQQQTAPVLRHTISPAAINRTILGSDQLLDLCFAGDGTSVADFRILYGGASGNPIMRYDGTSQTLYLYYNAGGGPASNGQFILEDFENGIQRLVTGGPPPAATFSPSVKVAGGEDQTFEVDGMPIVLSGFPSCDEYTGEDGKETICEEDGKLHVRHGEDPPVDLEGVAGVQDHNSEKFALTDESTGSTVTVALLDLSDTKTITLPGNDFEPEQTQGTAKLVAEVTAGAYGTSGSGVYLLKARLEFVSAGNTTPGILTLDTFSEEKSDADGAGGADCSFVQVTKGVELQCTGYTEYSGFLRVDFAGGGGI